MTKTSMKKALSQEEIDTLIRAARAGAGTAAPVVEPPAVTLWDGRRAGQIGPGVCRRSIARLLPITSPIPWARIYALSSTLRWFQESI